MVKESTTVRVRYPIGDILLHPHKVEELIMNQEDYISILNRIRDIIAQRDSLVFQLGICIEEWNAYVKYIHEPALWEAQ